MTTPQGLPDGAPHRLVAVALPPLPEIAPGDDLGALIAVAWRELAAAEPVLAPAAGDVLVVTQKVVSKAEGRLLELSAVEPSDFARRFAAQWGKDARLV